MLGLGLAAGCELEFKGGPTELQLSARSRELLGEGPAAEDLEQHLVHLFGTAAAPRDGLADVDGAQLAGIEGPESLLELGRSLYERKCLHCHGNEGGGDGITSQTLRPVPRDFRRGVFKFDDIKHGAKPELADLERVIAAGIDGTAMISSQDLSERELEALARYVRWLAARGEVELLLAAEHGGEEEITAGQAAEVLALVRERWADPRRERVQVPPVPAATRESVLRGRELFHDAQGANCASCHGEGGRAPGPAVFGPSMDSPEEQVPLLFDLWGHPAQPTNLVEDRFRHGRTPGSVYTRIILGIDGSAMPGLGEAAREDGSRRFSDADLWAIVHYVLALDDPDWSATLEEQP